KVLQDHRRVALLGLPGSGKSTLIKRLATAYAFPSRKKLVDDNLPDIDWFPIFIRCRQLGDRANAPILEILKDLRGRAEIEDSRAKQFERLLFGCSTDRKGAPTH